MVSFVCYFCDKTMKKKQVERHTYQCGAPVKMCCIDCRKWFDGNAYKAHTSCISEEQQWHGKYWKGHKEFKKQNNKTIQKKKNFYQKAQLMNSLKNSQFEDIDDMEWSGWKNTIRKVVKKQNGRKIESKQLRKKCRHLYNTHRGTPNISKKMFKKIFNQKLTKAKNLKVDDDDVIYDKN